MRTQLILLPILFITFFGSSIAQDFELNVEGDSRIIGDLWLSPIDDLGSVHIGYQTGLSTNTPNLGNTFVGAFTGTSNTSGKFNTFFGHAVGQVDTIQSNNTFIGFGTGQFSHGNYNTFVGRYSGWFNEGNFNCFFGSETGQKTTGFENCFFGHGSGNKNIIGLQNSFYGFLSGLNNKTGNYNTCIGSYADLKDTADFNATAIGYQAVVDTSNKVRIGNSEVKVIEGEVAFSASSDIRLKEEIKTVNLGLDFINQLNPVIYHRINNTSDDVEMGIIAQELKKVLSENGLNNSGMVHQVGDGNMSVRYNDLFAPLIKSVQELSDENQVVKDELLEMESKYKHLEDEFNKLKKYILEKI